MTGGHIHGGASRGSADEEVSIGFRTKATLIGFVVLVAACTVVGLFQLWSSGDNPAVGALQISAPGVTCHLSGG
jgi:hypothetical protein